jgi:hypothetical protein
MDKYILHKIIPDQHLSIGRYFGSITINEIVQLTKNIFSDKDFDPEYDVLLDFRNCSGIAFKLDILDYIEFFRKSHKLEKKVRVGILYSSINQEFLIKVYKGFGAILKLDIENFKRIEDYFLWMNFSQQQQDLIIELMQSLRPDSNEIGSF